MDGAGARWGQGQGSERAPPLPAFPLSLPRCPRGPDPARPSPRAALCSALRAPLAASSSSSSSEKLLLSANSKSSSTEKLCSSRLTAWPLPCGPRSQLLRKAGVQAPPLGARGRLGTYLFADGLAGPPARLPALPHYGLGIAGRQGQGQGPVPALLGRGRDCGDRGPGLPPAAAQGLTGTGPHEQGQSTGPGGLSHPALIPLAQDAGAPANCGGARWLYRCR